MPVISGSNRRSFLLGLPACALAVAWPEPATAGAALPISLADLVGASSTIVVGAPRARSSRWEKEGGSRRIVTVSEVEVLQVLDGRPTKDSTLRVRTLGGHVGDIGQVVHGEAALELDRPQVLFLRPLDEARLRLAGLAQGHYLLTDDETGTPRLAASPRLADFTVKNPFSAVVRLRGQTLQTCEAMILEELRNAR